MSWLMESIRIVSKADDLFDPIAQLVRDRMKQYHDLVEQTVEQALQQGECGVEIRRNRDFKTVMIRVSSDVPYGHIYEHLID